MSYRLLQSIVQKGRRLTLILVDAHSVVYVKSDTPRPVVLFEVVKGMVTGSPPDIGSVRVVSSAQMHGAK
jgi:hypothetical protein